MLDQHAGGELTVTSAALSRQSREYVDDSPILATRFDTDTGSFVLRDFFNLPKDGICGRVEPERESIRIIEVLNGEPEVELIYQPRPDYGAVSPKFVRRGKVGWAMQRGADFTLLRTDLDIERSGRAGSAVGRSCAPVNAATCRYPSAAATSA